MVALDVADALEAWPGMLKSCSESFSMDSSRKCGPMPAAGTADRKRWERDMAWEVAGYAAETRRLALEARRLFPEAGVESLPIQSLIVLMDRVTPMLDGLPDGDLAGRKKAFSDVLCKLSSHVKEMESSRAARTGLTGGLARLMARLDGARAPTSLRERMAVRHA